MRIALVYVYETWPSIRFETGAACIVMSKLVQHEAKRPE
jgi:hypothetical protein